MSEIAKEIYSGPAM